MQDKCPDSLKKIVSAHAQEIIEIIGLCNKSMDQAGRGLICSVWHFINESLMNPCESVNDNDCIPVLDIVQSHIDAFRNCILDLEKAKSQILSGDKEY